MPSTHTAAETGAFPRLQYPLSTLAGRVMLAVAGTAFVALCAHVSLPLYLTPVPVTLQTFAVLLIGLIFGPTLAAATLALYLAEGAAGLPVFSPHGPGGIAQLLGPTGGFLLSYPFAAATAGFLFRVARKRIANLPAALLASLAADIVIFAIGAPWTARWLASPAAAWRAAVLPFLPGEGLKIFAAAVICVAYRHRRP